MQPGLAVAIDRATDVQRKKKFSVLEGNDDWQISAWYSCTVEGTEVAQQEELLVANFLAEAERVLRGLCARGRCQGPHCNVNMKVTMR